MYSYCQLLQYFLKFLEAGVIFQYAQRLDSINAKLQAVHTSLIGRSCEVRALAVEVMALELVIGEVEKLHCELVDFGKSEGCYMD